MNKTQISVVIPFYHAEDFFDETYQSIKNQSVLPDEIIVVIDGCGDKAVTFLQRYPDLIIINLTKNGGPAKARNIGVQKAKGEYIAFIDADDKWEFDKLEKQLTFFEKNPQFSACHTGINVFKGSKIITIYNDKPFDLALDELLVSSYVVPTSLIIKKSSFQSVDGFDTAMQCSEDHDLTMRLLINNFKIGFLNEPLSYLRREDHGNISSNGRKILIGHFQLLKKHWPLYKKTPNARSFFIYKTLMSSGGKSKGLEQKLYYALGKLIKIIFRIK